MDAAVSVMCSTPDVVTLAPPVKDVPGDRPISPPAVPEIVVAPVLVTVVAARTP